MKTIFAILLLLCVGGPSASNSAHASCFNAAQCNDGNQCTTDACVSTVCVNTNKADGTACSLGGYAHPSCLAGTCSTAEFCSDFFDNDEDGSTDERHYLLSNSCEGPRGVMEYSWNKLKPSGAPAVNADYGDYCNWTEDCYNGYCRNEVNELGMCTPISRDDDCTSYYGMPASWSHGVQIGCSDATVCLPPFSWTDPRGGAGNNTLGELCVFNSDCASNVCARTQTTGLCGSVYSSTCPANTYYREVYSPDGSDYYCIPNALADSSCSTADSCTWSSGHWACP